MLIVRFIVRQAASLMDWSRTWHWLAGGAIVAPTLTGLLGAIAASQALRGSGWRVWMFVPLIGPYATNGGRGWMVLLTIPAGAATAWVLYRVHRAFAPPADRESEA